MSEKLLLGLDLGVSSLGWCLCDEENHIVKKNGKLLWGVRLFDSVSDDNNAKSRRLARSQRRRLARRKYRIRLLQQIFDKEMKSVDPYFFLRLNSSFYKKKDLSKFLDGPIYDDGYLGDDRLFGGLISRKELKKIIPNEHPFTSIYDIRNWLVHTKEKADIRLIYLAIHHILKHRGNFIYGESFNPLGTVEIIDDSFKSMIESLNELYGMYSECEFFQKGSETKYLDDLENLKLVEGKQFVSDFLRRGRTKQADGSFATEQNWKQKSLHIEYSKYLKDFLPSLLFNGDVKLKKMLAFIDDLDKEIGDIDLDLDADNFEENLQLLVELLGDNSPIINIVLSAKKIFDISLLQDIMNNHKYISEAMVEQYEIHHKQKEQLKLWIKNHYSDNLAKMHEVMNKVFGFNWKDWIDSKGQATIANYSAYIGHCHGRKVPVPVVEKGSRKLHGYDAFRVFLKEDILKPFEKENDTKEIIELLNSDKYLVKQRSKKNGSIPYQIHEVELKEILNNQSKYYPSLLTEENISKILMLLKFRIPYYVGPLMGQPKNGEFNSRSQHSWVKFYRDNHDPITPWNFNDEVDSLTTQQFFIERMTNGCTYLPSCNALPRYSLLYTEYVCVSWLNKIKVNGKPLKWEDSENDVSVSSILEGYFKKTVNPTLNGLQKFISGKKDVSIKYIASDIDVDKNDVPPLSMRPWVDFKEYLASNDKKTREIIEKVIYLKTIFSDEKEGFIQAMKQEKFDDYFSKAELKRIANLNYKKFGKLSRELLEMIVTFDGKEYRVIDLIKEKSLQLTSLLLKEDKYGLWKHIHEFNRQVQLDEKITPDKYIKELVISPKAKRPLFQTYRLISELEKLMGRPIDEYYVECTRELSGVSDGQGQNSVNRLNKLKLQLKNALEHKKNLHVDGYFHELLNNESKRLDCKDFASHHDLSKDRLYLYEKQLGICPYCGKPLCEDGYLEIDHIIPRSLRTLEGVETNKVLVHKDCNQTKGPIYPIPSSVLLPEGRKMTEYLYRVGLMSKRKRDAILRVEPINERDFESFTDEQLTATSIAAKATIDFIKEFMHNSTGGMPRVIYSKASLVSAFRNAAHLWKIRDENNLHHAHDAFLNIVVGRVVDNYYGYLSEERHQATWLRFQHDLEEVKREYEQSQDKGKYLRNLTTVYLRIFGALIVPDKIENRDPIEKEPYLLKDFSGNVIWDRNNFESIKMINKYINGLSTTILISYRTKTNHRILPKATIFPAAAKQFALIPIKGRNSQKRSYLPVEEYGGYREEAFGFMSLIKIPKGTKILYKLIPISNLNIKKELFDDEQSLKQEIKNLYLKDNPFAEVIVPKIKWNSILKYGESFLIISGKADDRLLAQSIFEFILPPKEKNILRMLLKVMNVVFAFANQPITKIDPNVFEMACRVNYPEVSDTIISFSKKGDDFVGLKSSDLVTLLQWYSEKLSTRSIQDLPNTINHKKMSLLLHSQVLYDAFKQAKISEQCIFMYYVTQVCKARYQTKTVIPNIGELNISEICKTIPEMNHKNECKGFTLDQPRIPSNLSHRFEIYETSVTGFNWKLIAKDDK